MGKPSKPSGFTVTGTDGSDILELPSSATILNTTIDGRRGNDTLDLSNYSSAGVYVRIEYGMAKAKSLVIDQPFTGIFTASSLNGLPRVEGSIRNVENLIGTSGNDFLFVNTLGGVPKMIDGGEGNDVVNSLGGSATLIGGSGSDWLVSYWENNIIIGGANDGDLSISDDERDVFYLGSAPTVLDFEVGTDHILVELTSGQAAASVYAPGAAVWNSDGTGSSLFVNGVREVTLANVDAATAQSIIFGVVVSPINNVVEGGPGDDMLFAGGHTTVTRVIAGSGDDVVINFTLGLDTLVFDEGMTPVWSNTIVNGAGALVGTFEGGSITLQGLSMSDVESLMIEGSRGTLASTTDPLASGWSLPSDFL